MKYSLSARQSAEYLKKADEIKVQFRDKEAIPDFIEQYPGATINLVKYYNDIEKINWIELNNYKILSKNNFIIGLSSLTDIVEAQKQNIPYYYLSPAYTFQQLQSYKKLGVSYVILGAPLFFQMNKVKQIGIPVRVVANMSYSTDELPQEDGVLGTWIRPEDIETYEPYVDIVEFFGNRTQEQALFRIYAEEHKWPGELGLIIPDLNYLCVNRMVPATLAHIRLNCGQRCQENGQCQLCYRTFDLANPALLRPVRDSMNHT